jgi:hypothetical protein
MLVGLLCRPEDISVTKLLAQARAYDMELFCPGLPGAEATQVGQVDCSDDNRRNICENALFNA